MIWQIFRSNLEAIIWLVALAALAFMEPGCDHFSLCPLKNAGFDHCPGCGMGHAISWLFHGDLRASIEAHPLGIPGIIILLFRIIQIIRKNIVHNPIIFKTQH
ncbi:MAG: DUF2752 domain-containing protein [Bacteroidales bacterium]